MQICHVTPHLPPEQAANALLPFHLGTYARAAGIEVTYVAHPPRQQGAREHADVERPGHVQWIPHRRASLAIARHARVDTMRAVADIVRLAAPQVAAADLVHLHSNGLLVEVAAWLAERKGKPTVVTLYGTEIWHYKPRRFLDLFTRAYRQAAHVTFYSQGLLNHAVNAGLARRDLSVIYPPVAPDFMGTRISMHQARERLGIRNRHVIVNVKRLHPLAGQRFLLQAMGEVIRWFPDSRLIICGTGPLRDELAAIARGAGVEGHVTFAGLVDNATIACYDMAADAFALPSLLEACPTVALEALACGTPVVSSDNPGGVELNDLFGVDVSIVPRENPLALADAIIRVLETGRRVSQETARQLRSDFSGEAVARQYLSVYERALGRAATGGPEALASS
ncbi:MAG: glycosyltransferase family 4 protein [Bacteroidales bacterium]